MYHLPIENIVFLITLVVVLVLMYLLILFLGLIPTRHLFAYRESN